MLVLPDLRDQAGLLALTLLVRDEADIIEANIRYHLAAGVDLVIVTDHRSRDATTAILEGLRRSLGIIVLREESPTYEQYRWVTRMALMAHGAGAAWVINADADEFYWARGGSLKSELLSVPQAYDQLLVGRTDFPPVTGGAAPFWATQIYREKSSLNLLGEPLPGKVIHRGRADIEVAQGNHSVSAPGLGPALSDGRIEVLHFPMRTYRQFERKIVNGGSAYEQPGSPKGVGETWRRAYGWWREGRLRDVYDSHVLTTTRLAERLEGGEVAPDARLSTILAGLSIR